MAEFPSKTRRKRKFSEFEDDDTWDDFDQGIQQIFDKKLSRHYFLALYNFIISYCGRNQKFEDVSEDLTIFEGRELYVRISSNLEYHVRLLKQKSIKIPDDEILQFYFESWTNYQRSSKLINNLSEHLNRFMIKWHLGESKKDFLEIDQLAMSIWKKYMLTLINNRIVNELLKTIDEERRSKKKDSRIVRSIVKSFISLGLKDDKSHSFVDGKNLSVYKQVFEKRFITETRKFYVLESENLFRKNSISEYLTKVNNRLHKEKHRVRSWLHINSHNPVLKLCDELLIKKRLPALLENYKSVLKEEKYDAFSNFLTSISDIPRLCQLLSRIPGSIEKCHAEFELRVYEYGMSVTEKCGSEVLNNPKLFIDLVLTVYKKFSHVLSTVFDNDAEFTKSFDSACERFINYNDVTRSTKTRIPELLVKYCDLVLKKNSQDIEISKLEEILNDVVVVFKFIDDKYLFQKLYSQFLARRFLNQTSVSIDAEERMISKITLVCDGMEYTSKLQRMFKDVCLNKDLNVEFQQNLANNSNHVTDVDFSVQILTAGSWPLHNLCDMALPPELATYLQNFTLFYISKFNGRKLNWLLRLSKGELIANCFETEYIFQVSTIQMAILLQFNANDSLSFQQLEEITKVKCDYLMQVVQILLKSKLLTCDSDVNNINPASIISLCLEYKNKKQRINLNVPLKSDLQFEQNATEKFVELERKLLIQAAIVRVMKRDKELRYHQLLTRVLDHLSTLFKPKDVNVKKCIDLLVEKEYLERLHGDQDVYRYVA